MIKLLFGFQGRINRLQYWAGALLSGFALILLFVLLIAAGIGGRDLNDPNALAAALGTTVLGLIPIILVAAWCGLAIQVKRFHDRGRSGWFAAIPMGLGGFTGFMTAAAPAALIGIAPLIMFASLVINVWFLVELGFLPGQAEPNQYGDPPGRGGSSPSVSGPRAPAGQPQVSSLLSVEAAMERAIAERDSQPVAPRKAQPAAASAPRMAAAAPGLASAPASFGRRTTR
ncbi:MAG: DUF805 domain-containing protein [Alphaproteobacteria bacterium]